MTLLQSLTASTGIVLAFVTMAATAFVSVTAYVWPKRQALAVAAGLVVSSLVASSVVHGAMEPHKILGAMVLIIATIALPMVGAMHLVRKVLKLEKLSSLTLFDSRHFNGSDFAQIIDIAEMLLELSQRGERALSFVAMSWTGPVEAHSSAWLDDHLVIHRIAEHAHRRAVFEEVRKCVRMTDLNIGADEANQLLVVCADTDRDAAKSMCERLRWSVKQAIDVDLAFGIGNLRRDGFAVEELAEAAKRELDGTNPKHNAGGRKRAGAKTGSAARAGSTMPGRIQQRARQRATES